MDRTLLLTCIFIFFSVFLHAEGTHELAPNGSITINGYQTTDIAALHINNDRYGNFAHIGNTDKYTQLYINIQDPTQECIYLGFSVGHLNRYPNPPLVNFTFVIRDPDGNIVYGPQQVTPSNANIHNWAEAYNGPAVIAGSNGYIPIIVSSADLQSQGWSGEGNYYIQFDAGTEGGGFLIDYWDISVVNCLSFQPTLEKGRIWSYNWSLFAINDYGFPSRPFNGAFYVCAPDSTGSHSAFISSIDFNQSGFKPAAFNITFNSFGTSHSGNIKKDRRSAEFINAALPEYHIFLNDPVDIFNTAKLGELTFNSFTGCSSSSLCINVTPTTSGQIDILIDLYGNDGIYTENSADVLLNYDVPDSMVGIENCIPWDGLDGNGDIILKDKITLKINFIQGIYHFPIYDAELMEQGVTISRIRPAGQTPLLFYDDSEISVSSGTGEPQVNLNGCNLPCHGWINYFGSNYIGFGNLNTINSWWFANSEEQTVEVHMPSEIRCTFNKPNSLCYGNTDTISVSLDTIRSGSIEVTGMNWDGPGLQESHPSYAVVNEPGIYTFTLSFINSLGIECTSHYDILIVQSPGCCEVNLQCPPNHGITVLDCKEGLGEPPETMQEFIDAGYELGDTTCLNLVSGLEEKTIGNCIDNSIYVFREFTLFNDANFNNILDTTEIYIECTRTFRIIDTIPPEIAFDNPLLEGIGSEDTLQFQCHAGESDWTLPQLNEDDIKVSNSCGTVDIVFNRTKIEEGSCAQGGYLARYRYQWNITDQCNNTASIYFILEVIDTIAPQFLSAAREINLYCSDSLHIPPPKFSDECCCSDLSFTDTKEACENGKTTITRTWTLEDQCGNTSQLVEIINIADTTTPTIQFLGGDLPDGAHISIECEGGGFPPEIEAWDENSVMVNDPCGGADIVFERKFLSPGDCQSTGLEQWKFIWTATDDCGNSSTFELYVEIVDKTPPEIVYIPVDDCSGFPSPDAYKIIDNCGFPRVTVDIEAIEGGTCPGLEKRKYTYTAIDRCGNTTQISRIFTDGNIKPPVIRLNGYNPGADNTITIDCNSDKDISRLYSSDAVSAYSQCSEIENISFTLVSSVTGNCNNNIYRTDVLRWNARDKCGNNTQLKIRVEYRDTRPPIISQFEEEIGISCISDVPIYKKFKDCTDVTITSDSVEYTETCSPQSLAYRTIIVTDACGNTATYHQSIHIDRSKSIQLLNYKPIICESDKDMAPLLLDMCYDTIIEAELISVKPIENCSEYFTDLRTWKLTNICGQDHYYEQRILKKNYPEPEIRIIHPELGDISDESIIQLECLASGLDESNFTYDDKCGIFTENLEVTTLSDSCVNNVAQAEKYIFTLSDACGNTFSKEIELQYIDETPPQFTTLPQDMTIACGDSVPQPQVSATDNCSNVNLDYNEIPYTPTGEPGFTRAWRATDACGNVSTALQVFTYGEEIDCHIVIPDNIDCWSTFEIVVITTGGTAPYTYEWESTNGVCLINYESDQPNAHLTILSDSVQVKVTVIDSNGCMTSCSVIIECEGAARIVSPLLKDIFYFNLRSNLVSPTPSVVQPTEEKILIYPNPSTDILYFKSQEKMTYIALYNLNGQKLREFKPMNTSFSFIHSLRAGVYYMKVQVGGEVIVKKVVVQ